MRHEPVVHPWAEEERDSDAQSAVVAAFIVVTSVLFASALLVATYWDGRPPL